MVKLSSKFWKFLYQIDKIGPILVPVFKNFHNMTYVYGNFCTELGIIVIPGDRFVPHLSCSYMFPDRPLY